MRQYHVTIYYTTMLATHRYGKILQKKMSNPLELGPHRFKAWVPTTKRRSLAAGAASPRLTICLGVSLRLKQMNQDLFLSPNLTYL